MNISVLLSGAGLGVFLGFVLQRGRFCLNTAFRDILYIKDFTVFRAYVLALVVTMLGANILEQLNVLRLDQARQEFAWVANIVGGYLFGVGMVLAGGCASGTWYRVGEGLVGSWMAALGFMLGSAATKNGALSGVFEYLRGFVAANGARLTISDVLGLNRWAVIAALVLPGLVFVFRGRSSYQQAGPGLHWLTTGVLVGLTSVLAWYASSWATGAASGIFFTDPSEGLLMSVVDGREWDWSMALLAGVPFGALLSARGSHQFSWRAPRADSMAQQFLGGLIMGTGGILAGGCAFGHGITGIAALSLASLTAMPFIVLGCWTMVYFLFIRNSAGA